MSEFRFHLHNLGSNGTVAFVWTTAQILAGFEVNAASSSRRFATRHLS